MSLREKGARSENVCLRGEGMRIWRVVGLVVIIQSCIVKELGNGMGNWEYQKFLPHHLYKAI